MQKVKSNWKRLYTLEMYSGMLLFFKQWFLLKAKPMCAGDMLNTELTLDSLSSTTLLPLVVQWELVGFFNIWMSVVWDEHFFYKFNIVAFILQI